MSVSWHYFFDNILTTIKDISWLDIIDILVLSVVLFVVFHFMMNRRAGKLIVGVVLLILVQVIAGFIGMSATSFVLSNVFQIGLIALVIIFQPELRSGLEKIGGEPIKSLKNFSDKRSSITTSKLIEEVVSSTNDLSATKTGALIVFERNTKLEDRILTGTIIDAEPNSFLIKNIFFNKAPLHDGALIVRNNRLYSAGCLLPLSENLDIMKSLGTRHRAAIGLSENSDAIVLVVSEESGTISLAHDGKLDRYFDDKTLREALVHYLEPSKLKKGRSSRTNYTNVEVIK